jgi:hypothetical protein
MGSTAAWEGARFQSPLGHGTLASSGMMTGCCSASARASGQREGARIASSPEDAAARRSSPRRLRYR